MSIGPRSALSVIFRNWKVVFTETAERRSELYKSYVTIKHVNRQRVVQKVEMNFFERRSTHLSGHSLTYCCKSITIIFTLDQLYTVIGIQMQKPDYNCVSLCVIL